MIKFEHLTTPLDPFFKHASQKGERIVFGFIGDMILVTQDSTLPASHYFESLGEPKHHFDIGEIEQTTFTLKIWEETQTLPETLRKVNLRAILNTYPAHIVEALSRAKQLTHWLLDNIYCGRCGDTLHFLEENSALTCKACGHLIFPRLSPACIVLVTKGDEILLGRSYNFPQGRYSLLAGFVEAGESAEACAKREVKEEVGITIKNLRYFGTQSWSFPHSLMLGYFAEYESGEIILQEEEIEDAKWFTKESVPTMPYSTSIAYQMIQAWMEDAFH